MTHPIDTTVDGPPDRRARRLRSAGITVASLAVAAGAMFGGAAISAEAMPSDSPTATETATFGKIEPGPDGTFTGFECTLSGEQLALIEVTTSPVEAPIDAPPLPEGFEPEALASTGGGVVAEPLPDDAVIDEVVEVGAEAPASAGPDLSAEASSIRQGTADECATLLNEVGSSGN